MVFQWGGRSIKPLWTEFICGSMQKNYFALVIMIALPLVLYNLQIIKIALWQKTAKQEA